MLSGRNREQYAKSTFPEVKFLCILFFFMLLSTLFSFLLPFGLGEYFKAHGTSLLGGYCANDG